jgi:hypothetical protein
MRYRKTIDKINGVDVAIYEPIKINWLSKIIIAILFLGGIFLLINFSIAYGVNKERNSKNCIGAYELSLFETTLETAKEICVDIQKQQLDTIKENYTEKLKTTEENSKKWQKNYINLKNKTSSSTKNLLLK